MEKIQRFSPDYISKRKRPALKKKALVEIFLLKEEKKEKIYLY